MREISVFFRLPDNWKIVFIEQNHAGLEVWTQGFNIGSFACRRSSTFVPTRLSEGNHRISI